MTLPDFLLLDYIAVAWFFLLWVGYTVLADHSRWHQHSVTALMAKHRERWMLTMLRRELRMVDTSIQGNLLQGVAFFASTAILVIGGLVAVLGATQQALNLLEDIPFAIKTSEEVWELKVLLMMTIFVYAFFKFAWSFRLSNYCSILIGGTPLEQSDEHRAEDRAYVARVALVGNLSANHFNLGLRAYFFALAALGWFLHPGLFMLTTTWVVYVLYRREFRSRSRQAIKEAGTFRSV